MTPTACMFDLYHGDRLASTTYAGDQALFTQALQGGWDAMFHKLTQGSDFVDPLALGRLKYAAAAGLLAGVYHFMDDSPLSSQVANFMHMVGQARAIIAPAKLHLAIDNEPDTATAATDALGDAFARAVFAATGIKPECYGNRDNFYSAKTVGFMAACPLWLAEYGTHPILPPGWQNWQFHQYSDGRHGPNPVDIPGLGLVDQSVFAGSRAELRQLWEALP